MNLPYVRIPESTRKILLRLKKDIVVLEISRKVAMGMLGSEVIGNEEENGCRFEYPGKEMDTYVSYIVNSCQR